MVGSCPCVLLTSPRGKGTASGMTTEQPEEIPHVVRAATEDEHDFIIETTAKVRQPPGCPWRAWENVGGSMAKRALERGRALVIDAGGIVLGFVLLVEGAVEMLYVKRDFRGEGFGESLLTAAGVGTLSPLPVTATTASFRAWCRSKGRRWQERREAA